MNLYQEKSFSSMTMQHDTTAFLDSYTNVHNQDLWFTKKTQK